MYALGSKIGRADLTNSDDLESIERELREMISHLRAHSHHEDTFIHPLYRELGQEAVAIDEEHDDLEQGLNLLEAILNQKEWQKLYPQFNRFLASYLSHQDEEEQMQAAVLWKHFDNARLGEVFIAFNKDRSPEAKAKDLAFLIPGLSPPEIMGMLHHLKASSPPAAFQAACQIAENNLESSRWSKIHAYI